MFSGLGELKTENILTEWFHREGCPATLPAQDYLLGEACRVDARVSLIEVICVRLAIRMGQEAIGDRRLRQNRQPSNRQGHCGNKWTLSLEACENGSPMSWAKFERGNCLRCPPCCFTDRGTGAVGRSELSHRAEEFARGHFRAPIEAAVRDLPAQSRARPEHSDTEEKGTPWEGSSSKGAERAGVQGEELTGAALAPKNETTLQECAHADRRSRCSRFPKKFWISCRLPK